MTQAVSPAIAADAGLDPIEDLIARMTLEEKAGQLTVMPAALAPAPATAANPEAVPGSRARMRAA